MNNDGTRETGGTGRFDPATYRRLLGRRVAIETLLVLVVVEALFVAEKFNEIVVTVLDQGAPLGYVPLFVLLRMPEVLALALPIALAIACYRALDEARENREFMVLAAMGIPLRELRPIAWRAGILALAVSLVVSGLIAPWALYGQRSLIHRAALDVLEKGGGRGLFQTFDDLSVFTTDAAEGGDERKMFIHWRRPGTDETQRMIVADAGRIDVVAEGEFPVLRLDRPLVLDFASGERGLGRRIAYPDGIPLPPNLLLGAMRAARIDQGGLDRLIRIPPRGRDVGENLTGELATSTDAADRDRRRRVELGHRTDRALLSFLAPFVAALALAAARPRTRVFVLPGLVAAVLAIDLIGATLVQNTAGHGVLATLAAAALLPGALLALALLAIARAPTALLAPVATRA